MAQAIVSFFRKDLNRTQNQIVAFAICYQETVFIVDFFTLCLESHAPKKDIGYCLFNSFIP